MNGISRKKLIDQNKALGEENVRLREECESLMRRIKESKRDSDDRGEFGYPGVGSSASIRFAPLPPLDEDYRSSDMYRAGQRLIDAHSINSGDDSDGSETPNTAEARRIERMVPEVMRRFYRKNTKYAKVQTGHDLGAKGIIPDINRKTGVLVDRLWDGSPEVDEDTIEVIDDLIGHLFLLREKLVTKR